MRLTPKQNAVIWCLQNGWVLITSSESRVIICANNTSQFEFGRRLFDNLLGKGLIHQLISSPFDFVLTKEGKNIKTKPVTI